MKRLHPEKIDTPEYYEKIWGEEFNKRPYYDAVRMRALAKMVRDGDRVLDVGAGVFGTAQYLKEHHPDIQFEAHALDFSYTAKEIVDGLNLGIYYQCSPVEKMGDIYPDDSFDVVVAGEIIEHIEDVQWFVRSLGEVAKDGGWICLSTVNTESENAIKHGDYPEHIWEFTPQELVDLLSAVGVAIYETVGDYHFIYCKVNKSLWQTKK